MQATNSLKPGEKLGPYEILAPIGAGGHGQVSRPAIRGWTASSPRRTAKEEFTERFEREARAVAALNHPHICSCTSRAELLVMEYIEGRH